MPITLPALSSKASLAEVIAAYNNLASLVGVGAPGGAAGGALSGSYPNPSLALGPVTPWADFLPVISQGATITYSGGFCRWTRIGPTVHLALAILLTSAGTAGSALAVTLPAGVPTIHNTTQNPSFGSGMFYGGAFQSLIGRPDGASSFHFYAADTTNSNLWGITPAITVAATNQLSFSATYETSDP